MKFKIFIMFVLALSSFSDTVNFKVLNWNAENFTGQFIKYPYYIGSSKNKVKNFRTVVNSINPDIIIMEEMRNEGGVNMMLDSLNNGTNVYSKSDSLYLSKYGYSDVDSAYANMIFYKKSVATLLSHTKILTVEGTRFLDKFKLDVSGNKFYIFACHLKSSKNYMARRLAQVEVLRDSLNALPEGSEFLVCGDMNFYNNGDESYEKRELAYLKFIQSETNNNGRCEDPLGSGQWDDAYIKHSQSTSKLDDRFDFIFNSYGMNDNSGIDLVAGSYKSVGNDGNHYNQAINSGSNSAVSQEVANALFEASDHLPIVAEYTCNGSSSPNTYQTNFDNGSLEPWSSYCLIGDECQWQVDSYGGKTFAKVSAYFDGGPHEADTWLVSPKFNFKDYFSGSSSIELKFKTAKGYDGDVLSLWISTDYQGEKESTWGQLAITNLSQGNWEWTETTCDLSDYADSSNVYLAFEYTSQSSKSATWELDDIVISQGNSIIQPKHCTDVNLVTNYPNPFNPETKINFTIAKNEFINLTVYNSKGEVVKTLINAKMSKGNHSVLFNGTSLNSGVYYCRLKSKTSNVIQKMVLIK